MLDPHCLECYLLKLKIEALEKYIFRIEERLELKDMAYYTNTTATTVQVEFIQRRKKIQIFKDILFI